MYWLAQPTEIAMYSDHTIFSRSTSEFLTPPRRPVYEQEYQLEYPEPEFTIIDSPWSSSSSSSLPDQSSSYPLASLQTALTPEILDTAPAPGYIYGPDETYDPTLEHVFQALMRDAEASLSFSPSDYPPSSPPNGIDPSKISQPSFPSVRHTITSIFIETSNKGSLLLPARANHI